MNVVAVLVILLSAIPVYLAHRLTREEAISARGGTAIAESTAVPVTCGDLSAPKAC